MTLAKFIQRALLGAAVAAAVTLPAASQGSFPGSGAQPVSRGATGRASLTQNNLIFGNGTSPVGFIAPGTAGRCLVDTGTIWSPGYCITASGAISAGGTSVTNPGTGFLEYVLPVQTAVGASFTFGASDLYTKKRLSNTGSAFSATLPPSSAQGMVNGARITIGNVDATATLTLNAGAGTTIVTTTVGPGRTLPLVYDLPNTAWRIDDNAAGVLLNTNNLSELTNPALAFATIVQPAGPSAIGGVNSIALVAHQWIDSISILGVPHQSQPGCGDLSNAAASCATDATNANNISSGFLALARGGLGGSQSAATANQIPVYPGSAGAAVPISATSWFDGAYCNTVGWFIVRFTSIWTCAQGIPANVVWFGADNTGASTSTAAFNSAATAAKYVVLPPGSYLWATAPSAFASPVTVKGSGRDVTTINVSYTTGNTFGINSTKSEFADFTINHTGTATAGCDFNIGSIRAYIHDIYDNAPYCGVNFTTAATLSRLIDFECRNVTPNATAANSSCVQMGAIGGGGAPTTLWIDRLQNDTDTPSSPNYACINALSGDTLLIHSASCLHGLYGLAVTPGTGDGVAVTKVSQSLFDGATDADVLLANVGTGDITRSEFVDTWFGDASSGQGLVLGGSGSGGVDGVDCIGCQFILNATGFQISTANWINVNILGGWAAGNNVGLWVFPANVSKLKITSMNIAPSNGIVLNGTGLEIAAGASADVTVQGNTIIGNTTNCNIGALTGGNNRIEGNPGCNPFGLTAGASTGTSASTITAGSSPETHYVTQSASFNAVVKSGSTSLCTVPSATVPCVIDLGPNESYTVTWTTTQPTYSKFVH